MSVMPTDTSPVIAAKGSDPIPGAVACLSSGGLVVFPTETVYGLAASATSEAGVAALRTFKAQTGDRPFTVHIAQPEDAAKFADVSHPAVARFLRKAMPGPVTVVIDVSPAVMAQRLESLGIPAQAAGRIYQNNSVGLRCPDHSLARQFLTRAGAPVVAASANRPGTPLPLDATTAAASVGDAAGAVIDGGPCKYGKPSTMVRITLSGPHPKFAVEQAGVLDERFIRKLLRHTVLMVCSGNTCRSPMAEGLARQLIAKQRGLSPADLETAGVRVTSAGAFASPGMPASPEAVEAMSRVGVDISKHRSRVLSVEMLHEADEVYCMTRAHLEAVRATSPSDAHKASLLDPNGDIEDPVGSGVTTYIRCAERIRRHMEQRIKEQGS